MCRNKRSSGNQYDSLSGHAYMIAFHSQMIITAVVTAKQCHTCSSREIKGLEPPKHNCSKNYTGSSKAMEGDASFFIYEELYFDFKKKIALQYIVSNDDSSMRVLLKHSCNHLKGNIKLEIPDPKWLADFSHRTKVVAKTIFMLATAPKSIFSCTKVDAIRVKKYYGYMLKSNCMKTVEEINIASKLFVKNLFNNYEYCDTWWCKPKTLLETNRKNTKVSESNAETKNYIEIQRTKDSYHRIKMKDSTLYEHMHRAYILSTIKERLKESLYNFLTQKNKALNNNVAKYAPKN